MEDKCRYHSVAMDSNSVFASRSCGEIRNNSLQGTVYEALDANNPPCVHASNRGIKQLLIWSLVDVFPQLADFSFQLHNKRDFARRAGQCCRTFNQIERSVTLAKT